MGKGRPETLSYYKEKIKCERCGGMISRNGMSHHHKTNKCKGIKKPIRTIEQIYEYNRQWRKKNREKRNAQQLKYYYKNKYRWLIYNDPNVRLVEKKPIILYFD
tara:strand:- start:279 stop:590 length:312 start_codon:yes stop_codon:yes gene_type:complete